jgi:hypothetical protein
MSTALQFLLYSTPYGNMRSAYLQYMEQEFSGSNAPYVGGNHFSSVSPDPGQFGDWGFLLGNIYNAPSTQPKYLSMQDYQSALRRRPQGYPCSSQPVGRSR